MTTPSCLSQQRTLTVFFSTQRYNTRRTISTLSWSLLYTDRRNLTHDIWLSEVRRLCLQFWGRSVVFHGEPCKGVSWESFTLPYLHAESRYSTADKWLLIWQRLTHDTQTYNHIPVRIQLYILILGIICCINYELGRLNAAALFSQATMRNWTLRWPRWLCTSTDIL